MSHHMFRLWVLVVPVLLGTLDTTGRAESPMPLQYQVPRTSGEVSRQIAPMLREPRSFATGVPLTPQTPLDLVERTIRYAQRGEPYFRWPVSRSELQALHVKLIRTTGRHIPFEEVAAMTDRAQTLLRESGGKVRLTEKVLRDARGDRSKLHGNISELRLARTLTEKSGKPVVLTKNPRSTTFDLTEALPNPRSGQLKVYKDPVRGLRDAQKDLAGLPKRARYAYLPEKQLLELEAKGHLKSRQKGSGPRVYRPTAGTSVSILPAEGILTHQASVDYARKGEIGLERMSRESYRWLGRLMIVGGAVGGVLLLYESGPQWAEFAHGLSDPHSGLPAHILRGTRAGATSLTGASMTTSMASRLTGWLPRAGRIAGRAYVPFYVIGQSAGIGLSAHDYYAGKISRNQLIVRSAGPAAGLTIVATCTTAGAIIGSVIPGPGTLVGAGIGTKIGVFIAIPASFSAGYAANAWYSRMTEKQQREVERFVMNHYGLSQN